MIAPKKEKPRALLLALCSRVGLPFRTGYASVGSQVTKLFFQDFAQAVGMTDYPSDLDKVALARRIATYLGVAQEPGMQSRGARITDVWFLAVIAKLDLLVAASLGRHKLLDSSKLNRNVLSAHIRSEAGLAPTVGARAKECFICGDRPLERLGVDVLEVHLAAPYRQHASASAFFSGAPVYVVCPSCHQILHLEGLQPRELKLRVRP